VGQTVLSDPRIMRMKVIIRFPVLTVFLMINPALFLCTSSHFKSCFDCECYE
jgi:hypothetical protein